MILSHSFAKNLLSVCSCIVEDRRWYAHGQQLRIKHTIGFSCGILCARLSWLLVSLAGF